MLRITSRNSCTTLEYLPDASDNLNPVKPESAIESKPIEETECVANEPSTEKTVFKDAHIKSHIVYLERRGYRVIAPDNASDDLSLYTEITLHRMREEQDIAARIKLRQERAQLHERAICYWLDNFGINDAKRVFEISRGRIYQVRQLAAYRARSSQKTGIPLTDSPLDIKPLARIIDSIRALAK